MQNIRISTLLLIAICLLVLGCLFSSAGAVDKKYLKTLPVAEQAMANEVDHWGLPFSDQLRRFLSGRSSFRDKLGKDAPEKFVVGIQHGLEKVPKNKYWFKGKYTTSVYLEAARNEYENFQVAVLPDIGRCLNEVSLIAQPIRLKNGKSVIPAEMINIYRVGYVKTIPARYPSLYTGLWPDYLLPNAPMQVEGTDLGLFWVEVKVPADAVEGDYNGQLLLKADGESVPIILNLHVYDFNLPDRVPFPVAVWTSPKLPWGKKMNISEYRSLAVEFLKHGVDPISVGKAYLSSDGNDFSILEENLDFYFARGLQVFEISSHGGLTKLKPLVEYLRKKGWINKALIYSNRDEPTEEQFQRENIPFYQKVHSLYPDLKVFLASEYHAQIDKGCDIWMTDMSAGKEPDFARRHCGKAEVWFYYCHLPVRMDFYRPLVQAPNMLIDSEAIEHRLAFWLGWKYGTKGIFIWAGNQEWNKKDVDRKNWKNRGWELSDQPSKFPYAGIHNGNGYLIYPGPHPSIRLKVLRDGLEDYGYLMELKSRVKVSDNDKLRQKAEELLSVPQKVLINPHYFNRDPGSLIETRQEIAGLIENLIKSKQKKASH